MAHSPVYEADNDHMMLQLILPSGEVKEQFVIRTKTTVSMEKSRIAAETNVKDLPVKDIMLILLLSEGKELELIDDKKMSFYIKDISCSTGIEMRDRRAGKCISSGYNVDPAKTFGCNMRQNNVQ